MTSEKFYHEHFEEHADIAHINITTRKTERAFSN